MGVLNLLVFLLPAQSGGESWIFYNSVACDCCISNDCSRQSPKDIVPDDFHPLLETFG